MEIFAEFTFHNTFDLSQSYFGHIQTVGAHISNVPGFIKFLSDHHSALGRKTKPSRSCLLQGRSCKWRFWRSLCFSFHHFFDRPTSFFSGIINFISLNFCFRFLFAKGSEMFFDACFQICGNDKKCFRFETSNFPFSFHEYPQSGGLDSAG